MKLYSGFYVHKYDGWSTHLKSIYDPYPNLNVIVSGSSMLQLYKSKADLSDSDKLISEGCLGAPDLVIEILSDSTAKKDMNDKYQVYEESEVREYWIVMPKEQMVKVFYLENNKYQRIKTYTSDEIISPVIFPDLEIDLVEVFPEMK